mgnify:CR=1 FL=1
MWACYSSSLATQVQWPHAKSPMSAPERTSPGQFPPRPKRRDCIVASDSGCRNHDLTFWSPACWTGQAFGSTAVRFLGLLIVRSDLPTTGVGTGSVGVGLTVKTPRILHPGCPDRVPHNPIVPGSSPDGPTTSIEFVALWHRDRGIGVPWCRAWRTASTAHAIMSPVWLTWLAAG